MTNWERYFGSPDLAASVLVEREKRYDVIDRAEVRTGRVKVVADHATVFYGSVADYRDWLKAEKGDRSWAKRQ